MQWRANVQNGFTTGIQTCLWLRWWETKRTKQTMVVCFWNESSHFTSMYHQEIMGWGAYLPLPGFDKKGRMVLMCQMEVLCTKSSDDNQKFFPAEDQPCQDQLQPPDVGLSDDHLHSSQGGDVATNMMKRCCLWPICPLQKCTDQLDIKGMVIITDMKGASANHLTLFNISIMKKLITMMEVKLFTKTLLRWSWIHSVSISYSSIIGGQKIHVHIFSHDNGFIWHTNTMKDTDPP